MTPSIDFDNLIEAIASRHIASMDEGMGTLFVPISGQRDLYVTPGWEGGSLPFCVQDADGHVPWHGDVQVEWTSDLEANIRLYTKALSELVQQAQKAAPLFTAARFYSDEQIADNPNCPFGWGVWFDDQANLPEYDWVHDDGLTRSQAEALATKCNRAGWSCLADVDFDLLENWGKEVAR